MQTLVLTHIFQQTLDARHDFQALNGPLPSRPVWRHGSHSIIVPMLHPDQGGSSATFSSPSGLLNSRSLSRDNQTLNASCSMTLGADCRTFCAVSYIYQVPMGTTVQGTLDSTTSTGTGTGIDCTSTASSKPMYMRARMYKNMRHLFSNKLEQPSVFL